MTLTLPEGYELYYSEGWGAVVHYITDPKPPLGKFIAVGLGVGPITQELINFAVSRLIEIVNKKEGIE